MASKNRIGQLLGIAAIAAVTPSRKRLLGLVAMLCLAPLFGFGQIPRIVSGQIWRSEVATKLRFERSVSFAEMNIYAEEYPYWEPLDSATITDINHELGRLKPWDYQKDPVYRRMPVYLDSCRLADRDRGRWFEFLTDTLVKHSPIQGTKAEIVDQECICLLTEPKFMVWGTSADGSPVRIYLGYTLDGYGFAMVNGRYYARKYPKRVNYFPRWLNQWKPDTFPPPLPNWPEKYIRMYENR